MDTKQALYTFGTGENFHLQHYLGAHKEQVDGMEGYSFRVWAPNAQAVHLVGDFTQWEENEIPMVRNEAGVWEVLQLHLKLAISISSMLQDKMATA